MTSIKYSRSGWIGNLLVRQKERGHGLGRLLMEQAISSLAKAGASTTWLTASEAGRPLYEKLDFVAIDRVVRWCGRGASTSPTISNRVNRQTIEELDLIGWGDDRSLILNEVLKHGVLLENEGGYCIIQTTVDGFQLGPWGCRTEDKAEELLQRALLVAGSGKVLLDVPESNHVAAQMLEREGFIPAGRTVLMYRGVKPVYRPEYIYGLASMGSMG